MNSSGFLYKLIRAGRYNIRYDLNQCGRYNEYNEAVRYASKYKDIKGMKELAYKLRQEANEYQKDIENIVNPKRETEEKRYRQWESWYKIKNVCKWTAISLALLAAITWILRMVTNIPIGYLSLLLIILLLITLPALLAFKIGESICEAFYNHYVKQIQADVGCRNRSFSEVSKSYYDAMDNLYLRSLEPSHREMVLMHREQEKHNKEMIRLEKERQMKENERLQEERRMRKAQERLLEIEEERERRRNSW